jgi:hypothetical protein
MTLMEKPTRQVRRALARQSQALPDPRLTEEIIAKGAAQAAVAAAAAVLTQGQLTDAELQTGRADLEARLETSQQHPEENLGRIEAAVAAAAQEPLRWLTQWAAQAEGIAADYDAAGRLAGLEVLDAVRRFGDKATVQRVVLEGFAESTPVLRERPDQEYGA